MDAKGYLQSYGWQEGQAFRKGGLQKPILVKHKKDTKGLGHQNDSDMWWERVFDGQLKSLDVTNGDKGVAFSQNSDSVESYVRKSTSPLYKMFVKGTGLKGTVGKTETGKVGNFKSEDAMIEMEKMVTRSRGEKDKKKKSEKKEKKVTKEKTEDKVRKPERAKERREKREKKEEKARRKILGELRKKDKKDKKKKKEKRDKKDSKDGKERKHKKDYGS